jgi:hypothetical protein
LGVGQKYALAEFDEQVDAMRHYLKLVATLRKWTDATRFEQSISEAMMGIENDFTCVLPFHKHVIEKIISMVMLRSLYQQDKTKAALLRHAEKMSKWLNDLAFGSPLDPGTYSVPMDEKNGELGKVKFNDGYVKCVELVLSEFLPKFITNPASKCSDWIKCFDGISYIITTLRQRPDFTDAEILDLERKIAFWDDRWIELTGREGMTNYIHLITSGHLIFYLNHWRNLYRFSNHKAGSIKMHLFAMFIIIEVSMVDQLEKQVDEVQK